MPKALRRFSLLLLAMGAGFFWAASVAQHRLADSLPKDWEGRDLRVGGVVASVPQLTERGARFEFDVERVFTQGTSVPRHISLNWRREVEEEADEGGSVHLAARCPFHAEERWQLTVRLRRPHGTANPHAFDFKAWALENNIRAVGSVRPDADNFRDAPLVWLSHRAPARADSGSLRLRIGGTAEWLALSVKTIDTRHSS